jgi:Asp-tRNA(Asn)/Glu-tRNA(Gln) amidotransferase A subunit family amidase
MQNIIWRKIESLQQEIKQLKNLSKKSEAKKNSNASLYGILKGVKFSWKDFIEAKKIWRPHMKHIE